MLSKSVSALVKALSDQGHYCSDEEVGLFINTALYLALIGKSPTAAYVGEAGENWLPAASLVDSGSIFPLGQLLVRARALGKECIADCRDSAAAPRWRQPVTAVSAISALECAIAEVGKLAYVKGRSSMGMDGDLVRSSTKFSGEIDFRRMANPKNGLGFLHSLVSSGGPGVVLSSRFVRSNEIQQTSTEILLCRLTSVPHPTLLAKALEGSRLGADRQYLTDELCLASAEYSLQIIGTQKRGSKACAFPFTFKKAAKQGQIEIPTSGPRQARIAVRHFRGSSARASATMVAMAYK
jgi:hypothetical protein